MHRSVFLSLTLLLLLSACLGDHPKTAEPACFQLREGTKFPTLAPHGDRLVISHIWTTDPAGRPAIWALPFIPGYGLDSVRSVIHGGTNLFINWADFPSVASYVDPSGERRLFGHWLQYSGSGTYDYDIRFNPNVSPNRNYDFKLHQDTVSAEHGFLSSAQLTGGGLQVSWLDGRYTKDQGADAGAGEVEKQGDNHGHAAGGAMTLRTKALTDSASVELDHRVCDCCNTATVATDSLVMVAYRDRSEHEIRDIGYVIKRHDSANWSKPKLVHADNWEISGCPVNGPALAANDAGNIAIVWYTAPADRARILFSRYDAALDAWLPATLLDDNTPLGRVDIQLSDDGTAYVTALTTKEGIDNAFLTLWTISHDGQKSRENLTASSAARSAGFPKIALFEDNLYWARTIVGETKGEHYVEVCWR